MIFFDNIREKSYMIQKIPKKRDLFAYLLFDGVIADSEGRFLGSITTNRYLELQEDSKYKKLSSDGVFEIQQRGYPDQKNVTIESNPVLTVIEYNLSRI